jgi:hypothetical protein
MISGMMILCQGIESTISTGLVQQKKWWFDLTLTILNM